MMAEEGILVVGGVDTHKDMHVAVAVDGTGRSLGTRAFPVTPLGYRQLLAWLRGFGPLAQVGVEGTGSWGSGLARFLVDAGVEVLEVDRPDRQARRRRGKSDPIDAQAAALAVLSGRATGRPKAQNGQVEAIRALRAARRSAVKARTQAGNQIQALVTTAPEALRRDLAKLAFGDLVQRCARLRPAGRSCVLDATRLALRTLARRWIALDEEVTELDVELSRLVEATAPQLVARKGVGTHTAAALLVAIGDNPERLVSEASFAALCGVSPLEASSGRTKRHRLNRGGNRDANAALWRIVFVRMRVDPRTKAYVRRRTAEGRSTAEIMRCLKRYVARELYRATLRSFAETRVRLGEEAA